MKHLSLLVLAALLCAGCEVVRVNERGITAYAPAWPWQDSMRAIERVNLSNRTNNFTAAMRGMSDSETISTNAVDLVERVVGAAVKAAIAGVKGAP